MSCKCPDLPGPIDEGCDPDRENGFVQTREWTRGDTLEVEVEDIVDRLGAPIDFTNPLTKAWFTVKDYLVRADSQSLWQGTYGAGIVQIYPGRLLATIPAFETSQLYDGVEKLYYDLQVKDATGRVKTVEKGLFIVRPDVTKAYA